MWKVGGLKIVTAASRRIILPGWHRNLWKSAFFYKTLRTRKFSTWKFFEGSTHGILTHSRFRICMAKGGREALREHLPEEKMFYFGHCPNYHSLGTPNEKNSCRKFSGADRFIKNADFHQFLFHHGKIIRRLAAVRILLAKCTLDFTTSKTVSY